MANDNLKKLLAGMSIASLMAGTLLIGCASTEKSSRSGSSCTGQKKSEPAMKQSEPEMKKAPESGGS